MKPKIIQALKQIGSNGRNWRKRWGVISDGLTDWFDTQEEAEARLRKISKPIELQISPL